MSRRAGASAGESVPGRRHVACGQLSGTPHHYTSSAVHTYTSSRTCAQKGVQTDASPTGQGRDTDARSDSNIAAIVYLLLSGPARPRRAPTRRRWRRLSFPRLRDCPFRGFSTVLSVASRLSFPRLLNCPFRGFSTVLSVASRLSFPRLLDCPFRGFSVLGCLSCPQASPARAVHFSWLPVSRLPLVLFPCPALSPACPHWHTRAHASAARAQTLAPDARTR